jgi:hypothetical protein
MPGVSKVQIIEGCGLAATVRGGVSGLALALACLASSHPAKASQPVACGGAAMMGGAQLMCSHTDPDKPAQFCTFSWDLMRTDDTAEVVEGSFLLPPEAKNVQVYQGSGFNSQITAPIVVCRGKKSGGTDSDD